MSVSGGVDHEDWPVRLARSCFVKDQGQGMLTVRS